LELVAISLNIRLRDSQVLTRYRYDTVGVSEILLI